MKQRFIEDKKKRKSEQSAENRRSKGDSSDGEKIKILGKRPFS